MAKEGSLWDDEGFRRRLEAQCKLRNVDVRDALAAAGVSRYYLNKQVEGRSTNVVMKLAQVVGLPPQELAFGHLAGSYAISTPVAATSESVEAAGQMFSAQQVMALLCLALNQKKIRREEVTELMLEAAHGSRKGTPPQPASDASESELNSASSADNAGISTK